MRQPRLAVAVLLVAALAGPAVAVSQPPAPATADDRHAHAQTIEQDFADLAPLVPILGTGPEEPPGNNCTYLPRKTPEYDNIGDVEEVHPIYFLASDTVTNNYDLATLCDNGGKLESPIGYAMHNIRRWMSRSQTEQGARLARNAFKVPLRTDTAYGITTRSYHVMTVRGWNPASYYETPGVDPSNDEDVIFRRIRTELQLRGFNHPRVKYVVFADLRNPNFDAENRTGFPGQAVANGNYSIAYQRYAMQNGTTKRAQWGCATEGDQTVAHELVHMWLPSGGFQHDYYVSQDLMYPKLASTFRGNKANGYAVPTTQWDTGSDSYTGRILSFPGYLNAGPGSDLHYCAYTSG